ncbi:MAG: GntR family transcriptional regulator [Phycisphaerae bacterium]
MAISRTSLREQIRATLVQRIGRGELAPGDRIVEAALAEEFGVSAIPVREAIRELVAIGVLESEPHRGAWVRQVSLSETVQALEVKAVLEALAVRTATRRLRSRCQALRKAVEHIVAAAERRDFAAFQEANEIFHRTIVEASGNRVLLKAWRSLAFDVRTRFIMDYMETVDPVAIAREHEVVVAALEADDAGRTAGLLASHANHLVAYLRAEQARHETSSPGNETAVAESAAATAEGDEA